MRKKSYEMDMCSGPILSKMLVFAIPLMLSSILLTAIVYLKT